MARLRLATLESRRCEQCESDYVGARCPHCGAQTTVLTARETRSLLIVEDPFCPRYERQERWRCRDCGSLYQPPSLEQVFANASRCRCGATIFDRADIASTLEGATTTLAQARRLVTAIKRRKCCRACGEALTPPCWCPVCAVTRLATTSTLPPRPTWVYVPTGHRSVALEDLPTEPVDPTSVEDELVWQGESIEEDTGNAAGSDRAQGDDR